MSSSDGVCSGFAGPRRIDEWSSPFTSSPPSDVQVAKSILTGPIVPLGIHLPDSIRREPSEGVVGDPTSQGPLDFPFGGRGIDAISVVLNLPSVQAGRFFKDGR